MDLFGLRVMLPLVTTILTAIKVYLYRTRPRLDDVREEKV